ncbi:ATP-binding protein [Umezawaea tangerina]|uniref:DNA topoisomerase (ATP-hydrolyzing) n=1 Tax=Umezawaea tangerina TaxID=84725 RepID=A0A2T0SX89_9PSEU|nr:ATP-binding protein [Umezawaea tangerina]PRY38044.1 intein/intein [Umezawaea tangerina]
MTAETLYGADDLTHLEGLEAVRKRPGMYIGSTDSRGINHLFTEIVDNSTDEGIAGNATRVVVTLHADGSVQVDDDGRGIPTGVHAKSGLSGVELVLTRLHAGGKFGGSGYKTSGGLHGVGASAVNALSHRFDVTVKRDGKVHQMSFAHGVPAVFDGPGPKAAFTHQTGLQITGRMKRGESTGTSIRYWYDARYFENGSSLDVESVRAKLRNTAFLVPGVTYVLRHAIEDTIGEETFHYPNGLADMVDFLAPAGDKAVSGTLIVNGTGTYQENAADQNGVMRSKVERQAEVEVALRWGTGYERAVECFTNTIRNVHGGTHRRGFDRAVVKALHDAISKTRGLLKPKEDMPTLDDVLEGMTAVVHVRIPEPQFTSQTKDELSTAGITKVIQGVVERYLKAWTEDRKTKMEAKVVLQKVVDASRVRLTQKQQKDAARRKTALEGASMPPKLVDCRATGVSRSELFLVEGDSALGCFTGDTMVAMAYGRPRSFADLVADWQFGITHYGYATTDTGRVVVAPLLEPRLTRYMAPLVRVTLDNGGEIRCTPDHLFRLLDGGYRRADELVINQSLMPLYRSPSIVDGGRPVWMNDRGIWALPKLDTEVETTMFGHLDAPGDGRSPVNHQVRSVEMLEEVADVYDLTVDGLHNFALETGVFVHNSARMARVSEYQALLPLRGKILNVQKASLGDTLRNAEIASIVQVLGAGTGRTFDLAAMRYGRVILMADADVDGSHIRTLLITLFAKYMRPVIEDGRLYAAMPPLHKVVTKGRNPETRFTFTQREMEQTVARLEKAGKQIVTPVPRFKGLGEMDADELWETTMNPATRSVRRITMDDVDAAETALELLMGEKVEPRRAWLVESSSRVDQSAIDL